MESDQTKWANSECINIGDPEDERKYKLTTDFGSPEYGKRVVVATLGGKVCRGIRCVSGGESPMAKEKIAVPGWSPVAPARSYLSAR